MKHFYALAAAVLLSTPSCTTTRPTGPAHVDVVAEGRDYHGFSLARPVCQERTHQFPPTTYVTRPIQLPRRAARRPRRTPSSQRKPG